MAIKDYDTMETKLEKIARAFNEPPHTIPLVAPTKPDSPTDPLTVPPSVVFEVIKPTDPQAIVDERVERLTEVEAKTFDTKTQNSEHSKPTDTKQKGKQKVQQLISLLEGINGERGREEEKSVEQVGEKRGRGRPKGSKNKKTLLLEKLSQEQGQGQTREEGERQAQADNRGETKKLSRMKKLSHRGVPLAVNLNLDRFTGVKGKTSLCYALLYAQALTPVQINTLLSKADPLNLTSAEVIALKLLQRTQEGDPKAEKIYWDILKNEQKNQKTTPVKQENSLLDEALEKAESAILGEIVVDNENNP